MLSVPRTISHPIFVHQCGALASETMQTSRSRFSLPLATAIFALICWTLTACGGGGGGGGSTPGGAGTFVEAQVNGLPADLNNLQVGDAANIQVAAYDELGNRVVLAVSSVVTTDALNAVSTVSGTILNATGTNGNLYGLTAVSTGTPYTATFRVKPVQARVKSSVVASGTAAPLRGIRLLFFASGGINVGSVFTQFDGTFNASIPSNATSFTIDSTTIPSKYAKQFSFNGKSYVTGLSCAAPLPTLTNGTTLTLPGNLALYPSSAGPPPPPTGCGG